MAEPAAYLLVALSGRALAVAARRARRPALVLDLFGDTDTRATALASRVVAGSLARGFDEAALLAAADELAPPDATPHYGLVYGSGLEDRPQLLARLSRGRRLFGNSPETVGRTKDPRIFFPMLARLGVPHPEIRFERPDDPDGWLAKRVGASGGSHVAPAIAVAAKDEERYFQRRVPGRPIGVSFLADSRRARILGFSEQWPWTGGDGRSFRFGGAMQPAPVDPAIAAAMPALLDALTTELGLVGLNSLDMLVEGREFWVIEVNPRPGANLDIFDEDGPRALFELHLRACAGVLPERCASMSRATAMAVVYAERSSFVPTELHWPDWVADRPAPGATIDPGAPVCTVLASSESAATVRPLIERRAAAVLEWLPSTEPSGLATIDLAVGH